MRPVVFIGSKHHAALRRIACQRANLAFHYHEADLWRPVEMMIKLLNQLKRHKPSVVVIEEFDDIFAGMASVLSLNAKHVFVRYSEREMSDVVLAELVKTPNTAFVHKWTSNEDFIRLMEVMNKANAHSFNHTAKAIREEGFIHAMKTGSATAKELILYYHKIWPERASWIKTSFENYQQPVLKLDDLDSISKMVFHKYPGEKDHGPPDLASFAYYATQMALRAIATSTRRKYGDVFAQLLRVPAEALVYWNKWYSSVNSRMSGESHIDQAHNIGGPAKEKMDHGIVEEFYLFGMHIETIHTDKDKIARTAILGPSYQELIKDRRPAVVADALLSFLVESKKFEHFQEAFKNVRAILGANAGVLRRFGQVVTNLETMKSMIADEQEE